MTVPTQDVASEEMRGWTWRRLLCLFRYLLVTYFIRLTLANGVDFVVITCKILRRFLCCFSMKFRNRALKDSKRVE